MSIYFQIIMIHKNNFNSSLIILLFVFTIFSKNVYSQCIIPNEFEGNTGANMTCLMFASFIESLPIESDNPYIVVLTSSGVVIGSSSVAADALNNGQTSLAVWGDDTFTPEADGALEGEALVMKFVDGFNLYNIIPIIAGGSNFIYTTNATLLMSGFEIESSCTYDLYIGCTDTSACNYNPEALSDDGSCESIEIGSCDVCLDGTVIDNDIDDDGICNEDEIQGCQDTLACNYDPLATDPPYDQLANVTTWEYTDSTYTDSLGWIMTDSVVYTPVNPAACSYSDEDGDGICDMFKTQL